jgi:hypothetical protein
LCHRPKFPDERKGDHGNGGKLEEDRVMRLGRQPFVTGCLCGHDAGRCPEHGGEKTYFSPDHGQQALRHSDHCSSHLLLGCNQ